MTVTAAGDFNVVPLETKSTAGIQSLRVRIPSTSEYYYVEYRQPFGFDNFTTTSPVVNGVLIHRATDYGTLVRTMLIDNAPSSPSFNDAALSVGGTFTDAAASISITLVSRTTTAAVVRVALSASPPDAGTGTDGGTGTDAGTPPACGAGETLFGGHCYVVLTAAQQFDRSAVGLQRPAARVGSWRRSAVPPRISSSTGLINDNEGWLGASDRTTEGTWAWEGGATFWTGGPSGGATGGAYDELHRRRAERFAGLFAHDCRRPVARHQLHLELSRRLREGLNARGRRYTRAIGFCGRTGGHNRQVHRVRVARARRLSCGV